MSKAIKKISRAILLVLEGVIVGFGAIMPGISGGTLCVAFGMYRPIIGLISSPKKNMSLYGGKIFLFAIGAVFGFVGLSGLASYVMNKNAAFLTCLFAGLIVGNIPELWRDAGENGRDKKSYVGLVLGFLVMLGLLLLFQTKIHAEIKPDIFGFLLCGVLWGLSFTVPGLSSSTLLLFFGLYGPMLEGISRLDMSVLLPLAVGMAFCIALLSKGISRIYEKNYSLMSHIIIGITAATVLMLLPSVLTSGSGYSVQAVGIVAGALISLALTKIFDKIK